MALATYQVALVGRPNVGKSTLFNRLTGTRTAIESEERGTTRDRIYGEVRWNRRLAGLVDTAGFTDEAAVHALRDQVQIAVQEADLILLVIDASAGVLPEDRTAADYLRRSGHPVVVVAGKIDRRGSDAGLLEAASLGFDETIEVSAIQGRGTGELLDRIARDAPEAPPEEETELIRAALLGRPNVGKSTLMNWLDPERSVVTSPEPGTTRDTTATRLEWAGEPIELYDTAGVRRRGRIEPGIEQWSVLRSLRALEHSETALLVLDAVEGPTAGDAHLAGAAKDAAKGLIIIVNKWDLIEEEMTKDEMLRLLARELDFVPFAPVIFTSAVRGGDPSELLETIASVHRERLRRIPTPALNGWLEETIHDKRPTATGRSRPTIKYVTQRGVNPPTFTFFGRDLRDLHFSYRRFLENRLRASYGFAGTGLALEFKEESRETRRRRSR